MTGTSARETSRPAKRPRPSATDHPASIAPPPVLFRLPSIGQPAHEEERFGLPTAMAGGAMAIAPSGQSFDAVTAAMPAARPAAMPRAEAPANSLHDLAEKKLAGQRLLRTLVVVFVCIALAVISMLAIRSGQSTGQPSLATSDKAQEHLESLSDISVPNITKPLAPPEHEMTGNSLSNTNQLSLPGSSTQLSLDKAKPTDSSETLQRPGLTLDASDLAKKPTSNTPQVQLGTPVPMRGTTNSSLAASKDAAPSASNTSLPLSTPRYETVSTPSTSTGATTPSSNAASGASPSLWDGAQIPASSKSESSPDAMPSSSLDSELSLIPSDYSSTAAKPASAQPVVSNTVAQAPSVPRGPAVDSASLGVTVGAGMTEPEFPQAKATATPDLDVASISSKFLEYSRQRSVPTGSNSTEIINPYAPATQSAGAATPATTVSTNNYTNGAYQQQQNAAGQSVPYGTTGATLTPYVRSSPTGAVPSGMGTNPAQSSYPTQAYPAQTNPVQAYPAQAQQMQTNPTQSYPSQGYPANNQAVTGVPAGAATTAYPSLSSAAGYNPGAAAATSGGSGFAIPPRGAGTSTLQLNGVTNPPAPSGQNGAYGYQTPQSYGYPAGAGGAAPAAGTAGYPAPSGSYPYANAPAPQGMIGQSGYATAASTNVAPPTPVTGKVGYGTSPTR